MINASPVIGSTTNLHVEYGLPVMPLPLKMISATVVSPKETRLGTASVITAMAGRSILAKFCV